MTWLGALNFLVLQWLGVRLARVVERREAGSLTPCGTIQIATDITGSKRHWKTVRWTLLRWIWPLTGWWSTYRWIARRR